MGRSSPVIKLGVGDPSVLLIQSWRFVLEPPPSFSHSAMATYRYILLSPNGRNPKILSMIAGIQDTRIGFGIKRLEAGYP